MKENAIKQALLRFKILKSNWDHYTETQKKEIVTIYFEMAVQEYSKAKAKYSEVKKKLVMVRNPIYVALIDNMVFNFYMFLLTYSKMNGDWVNFKNELKDISYLLWDSGMGQVAYKLFTPILDNPNWRIEYLQSKDKNMRVNNEFHKRGPIKTVICDLCGASIIKSNLQKHRGMKKCRENKMQNESN